MHNFDEQALLIVFAAIHVEAPPFARNTDLKPLIVVIQALALPGMVDSGLLTAVKDIVVEIQAKTSVGMELLTQSCPVIDYYQCLNVTVVLTKMWRSDLGVHPYLKLSKTPQDKQRYFFVASVLRGPGTLSRLRAGWPRLSRVLSISRSFRSLTPSFVSRSPTS